MNADVYGRKPRAGWHLRFDQLTLYISVLRPFPKGLVANLNKSEATDSTACFSKKSGA